jgi:putative ABC transport system ATP-binding protein
MSANMSSVTMLPMRGVLATLRCRRVCHWFGAAETRTQVLTDVDLEVGSGEVVILTGPSGSGKTTLLTLIGGLRRVQDGSLRVLGQEMNGLNAGQLATLRRNIGFIFQNHNLFSSLMAIENVRMATAIRRGTAADMNDRATRMLARLGLGERLFYRPAKLSGGQRQRVAIARALVNSPALVLADEPTASLDAASGQEVLSILRELADGPTRSTVVIVTHDQRVLDRADRIINLVSGRVVSNVRPEVSVRIVRILQRLPGLAEVNVATLTRCADQMFVQLFRRGDVVVRENTTGDRWFLVGDGTAEASRDGNVVHEIREGGYFGDITALSQNLVENTVRAKTNLEVFVMEQHALERILAADPSFDAHVRRELMSRQ